MPDTDEADADAERLWPEGYKERIRYGVTQRVAERLSEAGAFEAVGTGRRDRGDRGRERHRRDL
jgi:hypothetical protein